MLSQIQSESWVIYWWFYFGGKWGAKIQYLTEHHKQVDFEYYNGKTEEENYPSISQSMEIFAELSACTGIIKTSKRGNITITM